MTLLQAFARAALLVYPADFRSRFGPQIIADLGESSTNPIAQLFGILEGGAAMRLDAFARNLRYAARRLRGAPLFVSIVVLTFALGIGANIAVFAALNTVVLRALPFASPSALVIVEYSGAGVTSPDISIKDAADIRSSSKSLDALTVATEEQSTLVVGGRPYTVNGLDVTPDYLSVLGVEPQIGRGFVQADGLPGVQNAIISDRLWRAHFGGDPSILNHTILLAGKHWRVVGVLEPSQLLVDPNPGQLSEEDFLTAISPGGGTDSRGDRTSGGVGRLAAGVTVDQANAEFALISQNLQRLYPRSNAKVSFSVVSLRSLILGSASSQLWVLFAAVIGVLVIACANVGNLLAARWSSRDREFAVRRALGASSRILVGQLLVETGMLALLGAVCGMALAYGTLRILAPMISNDLPRASSISIDATTFLYALVVVVATTLLASLSPLLSLHTGDLYLALKSAGRGGDPSRGNHMRSMLVVTEIALALALVVTSVLMIRGFNALVGTPLGIRSDGVIVSDGLQEPSFSAARDVLYRLQALPGVKVAALSLSYPLGDAALQGFTPVMGRTYPRGGAPLARLNEITPDYFRALGISLLVGRYFTSADNATSEHVTIVNQAFVEKYLNGIAPIGTRLILAPGRVPATIVGVVSNERFQVSHPQEPEYYQPLEQNGPPYAGAVVYAPGTAPATIGREIRSAFAGAMPFLEPPTTYTMDERVALATTQPRFMTILLGALAAIALILALAGIFGVVSISVTQRSREFGVRMALGATPATIVIEVFRRVLITTGMGVVAGLVLALIGAYAVSSEPIAVAPFDPLIFVAVAVSMALCSVVASLHPALRATRVGPAEALRYE